MNEVLYDQLAEVEDRLWWHEARRCLVRGHLSRLPLPQNATALDVGCGTGGTFELLSEFACKVVGVEYNEHALDLASRKHPSVEIHKGDANALDETFDEATFDLLTYFNVLYHEWITDEHQAMKQAWHTLKPGGFVVLTDAAFQCLCRRHDRVDMGRRRFRLPDLRRLFDETGFEWIRGQYFNAPCFLPVWLMAKWDRWGKADEVDGPLGELQMPPYLVNEAMKLTMACERVLLRVLGNVPLGVSLLCIGRKPTTADWPIQNVPAAGVVRAAVTTEGQSAKGPSSVARVPYGSE